MSARTGFITAVEMILSTITFHFVYNFEFWTSETLDSGTKAYFLAVYADIFECVINPCFLLVGSPGVRKTIHKSKLNKLMDKGFAFVNGNYRI